MTKADDHEREMVAALVCFHSLLEGRGARSSKLASSIRTCPCQVDYAMHFRTKYIFMSICSISTALLQLLFSRKLKQKWFFSHKTMLKLFRYFAYCQKAWIKVHRFDCFLVFSCKCSLKVILAPQRLQIDGSPLLKTRSSVNNRRKEGPRFWQSRDRRSSLMWIFRWRLPKWAQQARCLPDAAPRRQPGVGDDNGGDGEKTCTFCLFCRSTSSMESPRQRLQAPALKVPLKVSTIRNKEP